MSKTLFLIFLLFTTPLQAFSCDRIITLQAGPEFPSDFILSFFSDFAQAISEYTHCETVIKGTEDYDEFFSAIILKQADIFLFPSHFAQSLKQEGLVPVLKRAMTSEIILLSQTPLDNTSLAKHSGLTIFTPSHFALDLFVAQDWLEQNNLTEHITFSPPQPYGASILTALKNSKAIATSPAGVLKRLSPAIKNKLSVLNTNVSNGAYMAIYDKDSAFLRPAIDQAKQKIKSSQWISYDGEFEATPYSKRFNALYAPVRQSLLNK